MLTNITLSAEDSLIHLARRQASAMHTSLNAEFRRWLEQYAHAGSTVKDYDRLMARLDKVAAGRRFTREEANER